MAEQKTWQAFFDAHAPILRNIARSLKPQAKAVLTVLNAAHMLRKYTNADVAAGRFDPRAMVEAGTMAPREGLPQSSRKARQGRR